uniref:Uncharacterized protein n=1 Tax=Nelumbo nucifera TaxID=4432 RepID=A0A822YTK3_NELNU|nr:TPA_asm: hypothetical protein HUJ06_006497 [Nelumbo nucifera]
MPRKSQAPISKKLYLDHKQEISSHFFLFFLDFGQFSKITPCSAASNPKSPKSRPNNSYNRPALSLFHSVNWSLNCMEITNGGCACSDTNLDYRNRK